MIESFANKLAEHIFNGVNSKETRTIPVHLRGLAAEKLDIINAAFRLQDLRVPPGNRLEKLKGNQSDLYSIRINDQFRIVFKWVDHSAHNVKIVDYH